MPLFSNLIKSNKMSTIQNSFLGTKLQINGFNSSSIAYCEAKGMANCFSAYAENCSGEDILEIGFNSFSGYVYIALENGISICSMLGRDVEYLVTNFDNGEEHFFDTYKEAETFNPYETIEE